MFFMLMACTEPTPIIAPIDGDEASVDAARIFCEAAAQASIPCEAAERGSAGLQNGVVTLGDHELTIRVSVESFITLEPRSIGMGTELLPGEAQLVATITLAVDGKFLFAVDLSHAASDVDLAVARAKVLDETLQRWMVGYGVAALDALNGDPASPALGALGMEVPAAKLGGYTVWAAYPMLKGKGLDPSVGAAMGPSVGSMTGALDAYLSPDHVDAPSPDYTFTSRATEDGLHALHIVATLGGPGGPGECGILPPVSLVPGATVNIVRLEGEVVVDGAPIGTICSLSEPVAWPLPTGETTVTWEQFAVATDSITSKSAPPTR